MPPPAPQHRAGPSRNEGAARTSQAKFTAAHRLFEQRVATAPTATALEFDGATMSYADVNAAANQLAGYLTSAGIVAESRVVVIAEPGFETIIALLGVLKAGGVYVPLDPGYPDVRVRGMLADIQPRMILATAHLVTDAMRGVPIHRLDADAPSRASFAPDDSDLDIDPEQTAYIYFTSGTSGTPKGVMGTHANLAHYLRVAQERYGFHEGDVMPAIARFTFSISMFELLSPLVAGGCLVLLERAHVTDVARMARTLERVTVFHAGPGLLRGIIAHIRMRYENFRVFDGVRHASSGGDMVPADVAESLKEIFSNAEVFVIYGCTEISCMGTTWPVRRDRTITRTYVGTPFRDVQITLLDEDRNRVPPSAIGEIHIAGAGLAKGYLNAGNGRGSKFFVVDGTRFYATGDMGRIGPDGDLEILGRKDFQVQLRGMRIEPGEIETILRRAPDVADTVVVAREDAIGGKMLVAYVVPPPGRPHKTDAWRKHLLEQLPEYMVPSVFVSLDALPRNENLKLDRRALPAPPVIVPSAWSVTELRPPVTATEKAIAQIWSRLLGVSGIGLDDNFFDLGGHSLLAIEVVLETERELGVALAGIEMLREPLAALARIIDDRRGVTIRRERPAAPHVRDEIAPTFFGPRRELYGVVHGRADESTKRAVLVCTPPGQEHVRAYFVLTKLARHLASLGVPVLRFDLFGSGNSLGENTDGDVPRWSRDIADAAAELRLRAPNARISALGVRLGATLLASMASLEGVDQHVYWDCVHDGAGLVDTMTAMHRARVRQMRVLWLARRERVRSDARDLLGFTYSTAALDQIRRLSVDVRNRTVRTRWLNTAGERITGADHRTPASVLNIPFDCKWSDMGALDDGLPDVGLSAALAQLLRYGSDE